MAISVCPECKNRVERAWPTFVIVLAICLFPIGLLALLTPKKPEVCPKCSTPLG